MENREDLATLVGWENGKAKADAMGEVIFASSFVEWFSEEAARAYGDIIPHSSPGFRVSVTKEPIGVCGLICPYVKWLSILRSVSLASIFNFLSYSKLIICML